MLVSEWEYSKGVKTPCFVTYNLDITNHKKRLQGFRMDLQENGILIEKEHILSVSKLTFSAGFAIMKQIVETMPEIDGIFFASDLLALSSLSYANQNSSQNQCSKNTSLISKVIEVLHNRRDLNSTNFFFISLFSCHHTSIIQNLTFCWFISTM